MVSSERPGEQPPQEGDDTDLHWLQEQLAHIGSLRVEERDAADDDSDEWDDPSGGVLLNMFAACEAGDAQALADNLADLLAAAGAGSGGAGAASVDTPGPDGDTALHLAALYGRLECVRLLLEAGAHAAARNPEDLTTPLHDAAAGGYLDVVRALLDDPRGAASLQAQDSDGDTPLHNAARGGHGHVVNFLLARGAAPAARNHAGKTPAQEADDADVVGALAAALTQGVAGGGGGGGDAMED